MRSLLAWFALAPLLFDSAPPRVQQSEYGLRDIHFMAPGDPHNASLVDFYRVALFRVYFDQPLYACYNVSLGGLGLGLRMDNAPHPFPLGDAWGGALDGVVTLRCPNNRVFRSSPRCGVENLSQLVCYLAVAVQLSGTLPNLHILIAYQNEQNNFTFAKLPIHLTFFTQEHAIILVDT